MSSGSWTASAVAQLHRLVCARQGWHAQGQPTACPAVPPPAGSSRRLTCVRACAAQLVGINWLLHLAKTGVAGSIIADEMGLGKTCQLICFLGALRCLGLLRCCCLSALALPITAAPCSAPDSLPAAHAQRPYKPLHGLPAAPADHMRRRCAARATCARAVHGICAQPQPHSWLPEASIASAAVRTARVPAAGCQARSGRQGWPASPTSWSPRPACCRTGSASCGSGAPRCAWSATMGPRLSVPACAEGCTWPAAAGAHTLCTLCALWLPVVGLTAWCRSGVRASVAVVGMLTCHMTATKQARRAH